MAHAEARGLLRPEELGWSDCAEVAIATVSADLDDLPHARPESFVGVTDPSAWDRFVGIAFVASCVFLQLLWIVLLGHLVLATGVFEALFAPR